MTNNIMTYGYQTSYLQKSVVFERPTDWLGWKFNSIFVLDNCREWDLSFLRKKIIPKFV